MRIHLVAVGTRMPAWVDSGFREYAKRLPRECRLELVEVAPVKRAKGKDPAQGIEEEGRRLLAHLPKGARTVALDERGTAHSTEALAQRLEQWLHGGSDVALLVGGADGLSAEARTAAAEDWSLSPLTLPHPLVRIIIAEQLYRAWSIIHRHPYHRAG